MNLSRIRITGTLFLLIASAVLGVMRMPGPAPILDRFSFFKPARAAEVDPPPTTHAVFTKLLQSIGIDNPNGEITSDSIFHTSNRNLYTYVYQQIFNKPEKETIIELSQAYGLSPTDAEIVVSGVYSPLMRDRGSAYTQSRAVDDMTKIQKSYARILQHKQLAYRLGATVASTEIFSNGSLDDSSFDLIHDLNIIEQLLFVDQSKIQLNQKPFKDPLAKSGTLGTSSASSTSSNAGSPGTSTPPTPSSPPGSPGAPIPLSTEKPLSIDDIMKGLTNTNGTLNECQKNSPLNKALKAYEAQKGGSGSSTSSGSAGSGTSSISLSPPAIRDITPPENTPITTTPAAPVTFSEPDLCDDISNNILDPQPKDSSIKSELIFAYPPNSEKHIFCVSLDTRSRSYTSFTPGQSCIQCTVAAMAETMKKLLSKSLAPNKLTGNVYESSKCKSINLSSMLDLNINLIPVPIITPQKLGPFVGHDIGKEWDRFVKNSTPFGTTKGASSQRATDESYQNVGPDATQTQLLNEITTTIQREVSSTRERLANHPVARQGNAKSEGYQQIMVEMRLMTSYFASFQEMLQRFNDTTCKTILDKPDINS